MSTKPIVSRFILGIVDFFYLPFKKYISLQTFRYAVCGGSNAVLNLLVFSLSYNFVFDETQWTIAGFTITRYISAYLVALSISFPMGFCLNKFVVFQLSNLPTKIQLLRYGFVTVTSTLFDYLLLHLLIGYFQFWATPSQAFIIVVLSLYSYFCQTYFTFKTIR